MRREKSSSLLVKVLFVSLMSLSLAACGKKEEKQSPLLESIQETESEDAFKLDNIAIAVTDNLDVSDATQPILNDEDMESLADSGNSNSDVESGLLVPDGFELTEEEATLIDSLVTSGMSDKEISEILLSSDSFSSVDNIKNLIDETLKLKAEAEINSDYEMETIDYSNDKEMLELMEKSAQKLEEDMQKEPINRENH